MKTLWSLILSFGLLGFAFVQVAITARTTTVENACQQGRGEPL